MPVPLPDMLPLQPYFRECVWGGQRLRHLYGKSLPPGATVGESYEVSALRGQEAVVSDGPLTGRDLRSLTQEYEADLVGEGVWRRFAGEFPLLIKLIDAHEDLSVQVHPDDEYARASGLGQQGKMEAWFVLHSEGGRAVFGLRKGLGRQEVERALAANEVESALRYCDLAPGDLVFVPPGIVHALSGGTVLYEVQQSSDLTFRLYDYGRKGLDGKPRELHIERAMDVIRLDPSLAGPTPWRELPDATAAGGLLVDCDYFQLQLFRVGAKALAHSSRGAFQALTVIVGEAEVRASVSRTILRAGASLLVPAHRDFAVESAGEAGSEAEYLIASPVAE